MEDPNRRKKRLFYLITLYSLLFIIIGLTITIIVFQIRNQKEQLEQLTALENTITEQLARQTELLLESDLAITELVKQEIAELKAELKDDLTEKIVDGTQTTSNMIRNTNNRIQQLNAVYSGLLSEQQKRTLDSIYSEAALAEKEQNAARLFRAGNYARAGAEYAIIAHERPDNTEARFYYLYSMFLGNKLDRNNYRQIKEGFGNLQRNGYYRAEIREVLEYIATEEGGLSGGNQ